jgi:hypothetical protein
LEKRIIRRGLIMEKRNEKSFTASIEVRGLIDPAEEENI